MPSTGFPIFSYALKSHMIQVYTCQSGLERWRHRFVADGSAAEHIAKEPLACCSLASDASESGLLQPMVGTSLGATLLTPSLSASNTLWSSNMARGNSVTALAAVQKLEGKGNIMGISMGSSEGAGYANAEGHWSAAHLAPSANWRATPCYVMSLIQSQLY